MKVLTGRATIDIAASVQLNAGMSELTTARAIERAQASMLYELRKGLEKKMAELSRDDIKFTLEELQG